MILGNHQQSIIFLSVYGLFNIKNVAPFENKVIKLIHNGFINIVFDLSENVVIGWAVLEYNKGTVVGGAVYQIVYSVFYVWASS